MDGLTVREWIESVQTETLPKRLYNFLKTMPDIPIAQVDQRYIREMVLNPQFQGDKKRNPYCAILYKSGMAMLSVISNPADCDKAIKNEHEIIEIDGEPERLFYYFLAETRDQAWAEGMARMEKLVELGEFKLDGEIYKEY
ncbi:hypothetical protein GCM10011386_29970 [Parapedobacter defluvii]|uniref:Uncharacterized protein n=2 Tax=Parapedobacter defluvii TaxID=2045106 RepID=A0ABQ1M982_9SPHI|nr:hypothetical protein GCM10011386_29970 [Parapedobacter defluvii]